MADQEATTLTAPTTEAQPKQSRWGATASDETPADTQAEANTEAGAEARKKALAIAQMLNSKLGGAGGAAASDAQGITGQKRGREEDVTDGRKRRKVFVPATQSKETFMGMFNAKKVALEAQSGARLIIESDGSAVTIEADNDTTINTAETLVQDLFLTPVAAAAIPASTPPPAAATPTRTSRFGAPTPSRFGAAPVPGATPAAVPGFGVPAAVPGFGAPNMPSTRTMQVPNEKVGLIIGRGGESIKQIQNMSGAQVQIAPEPAVWAPTREVTLTGSTQSMDAAEAQIKAIVERGDDRGGRGGGGGGAPTGGPGLGYGGESKTISIPNQMVGLLIGKGGDTIRMLQQRSGASIQVTRDSESAPGATERVVTLSGTAQQVAEADRLIQETLTNVDNVSGSKISIPNHCVGMIIGRGGETIRGLSAKTGARIQISKDERGPEREVTLQGPPQAVEFAKREIMAMVQDNEMRGGAGGAPGGSRGGFDRGGYGGHGGRGPPNNQWNPYGGGNRGYGGGYGGPQGYGNPYGGPQGGPGGYGAQQQQQRAPAQAPAAPTGAAANPAQGQQQMKAYTDWANQYYQYYGQWPQGYDPAYVQQWQNYYQQLQQYNQATGNGQAAPANGQVPPAGGAAPAAGAPSGAPSQAAAPAPGAPAAAAGPSSDLPPGL